MRHELMVTYRVTFVVLLAALLLPSSVSAMRAEDTVTVASELRRMRTADHLYRPQRHRIVQYSGFDRRGGNPDRVDCLYVEKGWRVVADHKGPGVVTRIWTTHGAKWREIKVEADGKIIFSGPADDFFQQNHPPFLAPIAEVRSRFSRNITQEEKAVGKKQWAVSYAPIPFERRFRYMQREKVYANIDIKALPESTRVESFLKADPDKVAREFEKTAKTWSSMDLLGEKVRDYKRVYKRVNVPAAKKGKRRVVSIAELAGPGIIRELRIKADPEVSYVDTDILISWDNETKPSVAAPIDYGFGSRAHRTLALGQTPGGWRFCRLPMPYQKKATLSLRSKSASPFKCEVVALVEEQAELPRDVLYLHCYQNEGQFPKGGRFEKPDLPLKSFFYHNGYTAFSHSGSGHIVAYMDLFECQPELDEHVFLDGERAFPDNSWNGTGHEDLFDLAWGHSPISSPMTSGGNNEFQEVNVKLFWNNPMAFRTGIRFNWEWAYRYGIPAPRDARFASVVYWYGSP